MYEKLFHLSIRRKTSTPIKLFQLLSPFFLLIVVVGFQNELVSSSFRSTRTAFEPLNLCESIVCKTNFKPILDDKTDNTRQNRKLRVGQRNNNLTIVFERKYPVHAFYGMRHFPSVCCCFDSMYFRRDAHSLFYFLLLIYCRALYLKFSFFFLLFFLAFS